MRIRAAVVGSGPNGLTAACLLARQGWEVTVYESGPAPGGALRSADLFGEGVLSDLGASVHPFGAASPAFRALGLAERGLEWAHPRIPAAHGNDDGAPPTLLRHSLEETAAGLGRDAGMWRRLVGPLAEHWSEVSQAALTPPVRPFEGVGRDIGRGGIGCGGIGRGPAETGAEAQAGAERQMGHAGGLLADWGLLGREAAGRMAGFARLGKHGGWPASLLMRVFREERSRALFSGLAAHSILPLNHPVTGAFGLIFAAAAHGTGWPVARGGSQTVVEALLAELEAHGGRVETGFHVEGVRDVALGPGRRGVRKDLKRRGWRIDGRVTQGEASGGAGPVSESEGAPSRMLSPRARALRGPGGSSRRRRVTEPADVVLLDLTPRQVLSLEGLQLPSRYARRLRRWDYGPGVVKVDFLLDGEIPWRHPEMGEAGTVHLGGPHGQVQASESAASRGVLSGRPFVLLAQSSAADPSRARDGRTACWAYAHVPQGTAGEGVRRAAQLIEAEIEAQAPGFGEAVRARQVWGPEELESWNPNLVGGSISGGAPTLGQFLARPAVGFTPYATGADGVFLCSSSTPPAPGAHGMSGFHAAHAALRDVEEA